ncbi:hypothetical protein FJR38_09475 [Anabaena sp. UHCC 0253]|uniref:hypothetical protein n=1 Tax=Anabaena sp. UHCC 0253 TaxID=2590019 RepID=UPI0014477957|nr:hypothetical protein [Anabaena sp. UHCC 0253]MTJ52865.1 hypothetical protein [Anabaena sp. UHCC 0253]
MINNLLFCITHEIHNIQIWLQSIQIITQIIFYVVGTLVTAATFLKARKTLLQPLRTEVFKEQIKIFTQILDLFAGKNDLELRKDYGLDQVFESNIKYIFLPDLEAKNLHFKKYPIMKIVYPNIFTDIKEFNTVRDLDAMTFRNLLDQEKIPPRSILILNENYYTGRKNLLSIMDSPILPKKMTELINDFLFTVDNNILVASQILFKYLDELEQKLSISESKDELTDKYILLMELDYSTKHIQLEPKAKFITDYVRDYFKPDMIFD